MGRDVERLDPHDGAVIHARLQLDPKLTGSVTMELRNVTAETALRAVCESVGCRWRLDQGRLIVEPDRAATSPPQGDPYAGITLNTQYRNIANPLHDALRQAAIEMGYTWNVGNNDQARRILKLMSDQWGNTPIYFGFVTL